MTSSSGNQQGESAETPSRSSIWDIEDLKGLGRSELWRLGGYIPGISRFRATKKPSLSPLTGRDEELGALRERWRLASEGNAQVMRIEGDAGGIWAGARIDERSGVAPAWRHPGYQCMLRRQTAAYHPLIEQLEHMSGIQRNRSASGTWRNSEIFRVRGGYRAIVSVAGACGLTGSSRSQPQMES